MVNINAIHWQFKNVTGESYMRYLAATYLDS